MKRSARSFHPKPDVKRMLDRAIKDGLPVSFILNHSARAWLKAKGYARKKDLAAQQ